MHEHVWRSYVFACPKVQVTCTFCGAGGGPSSLTLAPLPVYLFPAHFSKALWTESELLDAE